MTGESSIRPTITKCPTCGNEEDYMKCPFCGAKAYWKYPRQYKCYKCGILTTIEEE